MSDSKNGASLLLDMEKINKSFPGVKALIDVGFSVQRGQIHALMGENGAGKSTLIKVLTAVHKKDSGRIFFEGEQINPTSVQAAQKLGISTVYQEVNLVPNLSVAENIFLGRQPTKFGRIDFKKINQLARKALARLNLDIDVTEQLSSYSIAIQQMVAIARAVDISVKLLILDEPTSSLDADECERLFSIMRKLKGEGLGIIFITHFIDQVYEVADVITVLRNGRLVGEFEAKSLPRVELIAKMMGAELAEFEATAVAAKAKERETKQAIFLETKGLGRKGAIEPFDLRIHNGEVVGLAGLLGSGRTEIARLLFGIDKADAGQIVIEGKKASLCSPSKAIGYHIGYCPEDRQTEGIIPDLSIRENIVLALQASKGCFKFFSRKKQTEITEHYIKALNIAATDAEQPVKNLSGGNQQKVIVARWLASDPRFLILDEPTRGIDVGAKAEIQKLIFSLAQQGKAILFISSELEEVIRCSGRVVVLRDRRKVAELVGTEIGEQNIMHTIARG